MPINVLLVDDSAVIRGLMAKALSQDNDIFICGTASEGGMAIAAAQRTPPDVIVLDIEMPGMDGITALPELLRVAPQSKIIMASTLTLRNAGISMQAMTLGAADYLPKPSAKFGNEVEAFYRELIEKIKALGGPQAARREAENPGAPVAAAVPVAAPKPVFTQPFTASSGMPLSVGGVKALAIASSTGGPQALLSLFGQLKGHLGNIPIFITQHMPPNFTTILADHIEKVAGRPCAEGKDGEPVTPGHIYIAPGDYHMQPEKTATGQVKIVLNQNPQENYCRPAADPMLRSLSAIYGPQLAVVVLTGMGQDGMLGAKEVVANGGSVIAQDEASCVVYGMPKAVVENVACKAVLPLPEIGRYLIQQIEGGR